MYPFYLQVVHSGYRKLVHCKLPITEDLQQFRTQLINDLKELLIPKEAKLVKPWLRNSEVKKLLNISANTIQRLRVAGKLPSSKVGGIHYYRYEDIEKLMNSDAA